MEFKKLYAKALLTLPYEQYMKPNIISMLAYAYVWLKNQNQYYMILFTSQYYCTEASIEERKQMEDIYASVFTGAYLHGMSAYQAAKLAADFTLQCIENTISDPSHWYGVKFETVLPELADRIKKSAES